MPSYSHRRVSINIGTRYYWATILLSVLAMFDLLTIATPWILFPVLAGWVNGIMQLSYYKLFDNEREPSAPVERYTFLAVRATLTYS